MNIREEGNRLPGPARLDTQTKAQLPVVHLRVNAVEKHSTKTYVLSSS